MENHIKKLIILEQEKNHLKETLNQLIKDYNFIEQSPIFPKQTKLHIEKLGKKYQNIENELPINLLGEELAKQLSNYFNSNYQYKKTTGKKTIYTVEDGDNKIILHESKVVDDTNFRIDIKSILEKEHPNTGIKVELENEYSIVNFIFQVQSIIKKISQKYLEGIKSEKEYEEYKNITCDNELFVRTVSELKKISMDSYNTAIRNIEKTIDQYEEKYFKINLKKLSLLIALYMNTVLCESYCASEVEQYNSEKTKLYFVVNEITCIEIGKSCNETINLKDLYFTANNDDDKSENVVQLSELLIKNDNLNLLIAKYQEQKPEELPKFIVEFLEENPISEKEKKNQSKLLLQN